MICPRHQAIARTTDDFGNPLCYACFSEARRAANSQAMEDMIRRVRTRISAADWLEAHYGYRRSG